LEHCERLLGHATPARRVGRESEDPDPGSPLLVPLVTQLILAWDSISEYLAIHLGYPIVQ